MTAALHTDPNDELMTIEEVAAFLRAPVPTLRYWRHHGHGPHGFRLGRSVRYWRSDVLAWVRAQESDDLVHNGPRLD